jgi:hypothetical protein
MRAANNSSALKGSALAVWRFLLSVACRTDPPTRKFRMSRREIQEGARIGSLNTIDGALEDLESYNLLCRHSLPGSNEGHIYELLTLEENPIPRVNRWHVVATFRQVADSLESDDKALTLQEIIQWSKLTYRARRLLNETR